MMRWRESHFIVLTLEYGAFPENSFSLRSWRLAPYSIYPVGQESTIEKKKRLCWLAGLRYRLAMCPLCKNLACPSPSMGTLGGCLIAIRQLNGPAQEARATLHIKVYQSPRVRHSSPFTERSFKAKMCLFKNPPPPSQVTRVAHSNRQFRNNKNTFQENYNVVV